MATCIHGDDHDSVLNPSILYAGRHKVKKKRKSANLSTASAERDVSSTGSESA